MLFRRDFSGVLVCVLLCAVEAVVVVRYSVERHTELHDKNIGSMSCLCKGNTSTIQLDRATGDQIIDGQMSLQSCLEERPPAACDPLRHCINCTLRFEQCFVPDLNKENLSAHCIKELYDLREAYFGSEGTDNATTGVYDDGAVDYVNGNTQDYVKNKEEAVRIKRSIQGAAGNRQPFACAFPKHLKTTDVSCNVGGIKTTCVQKCIVGYTLETGITKTLTCDTRRNRWQPSGFKECMPFVDCNLSVHSGGSLECLTATTKLPPLCYVSCTRHEDRPPTPRQAYECNVDGTWNRQLPHCVTRGAHLHLAPLPSGPQTHYQGDGGYGR